MLVIIVHIHKAWFTDVLLLAIIATTTTTTTTTTIILLTRVESRLALVAATSQAFDVAREAPGQEEDSEEYHYHYDDDEYDEYHYNDEYDFDVVEDGGFVEEVRESK